MLTLKTANTNINTLQSISNVINELKQPKISFVMFFAAETFDFKLLTEKFNEAFPNCPVIGCTSNGEITPDGYVTGHLNAFSIYGDDFETAPVVLESIKKKGMTYKNAIVRTLNKLHLSNEDPSLDSKMFAISVIDFNSLCEEKIITMLSCTFRKTNLKLVGGSAGNIVSGTCFLSLNGTIYTDSAILLFVKTRKKVITYYENIYVPYGDTYRVTASDIPNRVVLTADNTPLVDLYSRVLNVPKNKITPEFLCRNPIGRVLGEKIYIATPTVALSNGGITYGTHIMVGSSFQLLKAENPLKKAQETAEYIRKQLPNASFILGFNCLHRQVQFEEQNLCRSTYNELNKVAPFTGFTTLGEFIDKTHVNQTLTLLAIQD